MNRKKTMCRCGQGRLPAQAPLANPYVPYQMDDPAKYEPRKGFIRGTMYPGLDLPFMGKANNAEKPATPMADLQTLAFAIQELALYLDTHREDAQALSQYRAYQQMYANAREEYARRCRPTTHLTPVDGPYSWLSDPWPWEYCANKEG